MDSRLEGKIAAILDEKNVVINKGSSDGVNKGDIFYIYNKLGPYVDPESGEELGSTEKVLGKVKVRKLEDKFSIASPPVRKTSLPGLSNRFLERLSKGPVSKTQPSLPVDEDQKRDSPPPGKVVVGSSVYRAEEGGDSE